MIDDKAMQLPEEIDYFVNLCLEKGVKKAFEIGTYGGYTTSRLAEKGIDVVTVDIIDHEKTDPDFKFYWPKDKVKFFNMDSHNYITRNTVYGNGPYDLAIIDGDHTNFLGYLDWKFYAPFANIVAVHDINHYEDIKITDDCFPGQIWKIIKDLKIKSDEITTPSKEQFGWGIVCLDDITRDRITKEFERFLLSYFDHNL